MNLLEQLKKVTKVVADTGDFESIKAYQPVDGTTNPSLILAAAQKPEYQHLVKDAIAYAKAKATEDHDFLNCAMDKLAVNFGMEILKIVPGRASTEVDARLSFDTEETIKRAREIIGLYEQNGISRNRVLIKIASTWEGIKAAEVLEKENIQCNLTLLFSLAQAARCAEAGAYLISPFVGRILDWHKQKNGQKIFLPEEDPGVESVKTIYNYYKKFGYHTIVMGASFRNKEEIIELAGCDNLTIAPSLMKELQQTEGNLDIKLKKENASLSDIQRIKTDEVNFRWLMNEDAMATEKLAEGIRRFTEDLIQLENFLKNYHTTSSN